MNNPSFIIAGERRSGTTMLYDILRKHKDIDMFSKSDMDFFIEKQLFSLQPIEDEKVPNWENNSNIEDYKRLFNDTEIKTAQKDADLLWWLPSHKRLAEHLTTTKFVFILRNPVKRAESQYWNEVRKGREKRNFKTAINDSEVIHKTKWQKLHLEYKKRGCYVNSLKHFFQYIPKERCHVIILEKLLCNWDEEISSLADFVEIDKTEAKKLKPKITNKEEVLVLNKKYQTHPIGKLIMTYDRVINSLLRRYVSSSVKKNKIRSRLLRIGKVSRRDKEPVDQLTLNLLKKYYYPFNKELETLLGIKIPEWN